MKKVTLKEFKKRAIRHGEVVLIPIALLPTNAQKVFNGKEYIVAHSETGHHHVAVGEVQVFQSGDEFFLKAVKESRIEHRKTFEQHETKVIHTGLYKIGVKNSYNYFAKRMEVVRD